jgi:hypothetical protein
MLLSKAFYYASSFDPSPNREGIMSSLNSIVSNLFGQGHNTSSTVQARIFKMEKVLLNF